MRRPIFVQSENRQTNPTFKGSVVNAAYKRCNRFCLHQTGDNQSLASPYSMFSDVRHGYFTIAVSKLIYAQPDHPVKIPCIF
jgi:hypothetical protein